MKKRTFKDHAYHAIAGVAKAFSHANRLEILDLLANGEKPVEQIAEQTAISVANASQHLQVLKSARLVQARREGHFVYYGLNGRAAYAAWRAVRDLALEQEPAVQVALQQYRRAMGGPPSFSFSDLTGGELALLLDVRPAAEYAAGRIENAYSIPLEELLQRLDELPRDKTIIAYCRGPFCTFADEAVQLLHAHGFQAVRLEEGYLDFVLSRGEWHN
jgi:rhodanese-related sulfurtransferase/DNA-binding transcriptional ArsR family regulator